MAATAEFTITITRQWRPCGACRTATIDPIVIGQPASSTALQTIASRTVDPVESVVVSVTKFHAGDAYNVIPEHGEARRHGAHAEEGSGGAARETRMRAICDGIAAAFGADRRRSTTIANYPVTVNDPDETAFAGDVARDGRRRAATSTGRCQPLMGGEDFSYMLEARPGAFIFIGNGDTRQPASPGLRLQRRGHPARRELLGEAGRDRAGGLSAAGCRTNPGRLAGRAGRCRGEGAACYSVMTMLVFEGPNVFTSVKKSAASLGCRRTQPCEAGRPRRLMASVACTA